MKHLLIPFLLTVTLLSCSDNPTDRTDNRESWFETNLAGRFTAGRTVSLYRDSTVTTEIATARFNDFDSIGTFAGNVDFNGVRLLPLNTHVFSTPEGVYNGTYYQLYSKTEPVPVRFDGTAHVFRTSGSDRVPVIMDSVASPTEALTLLSPSVIDTASRSAGFTVRWKPGVDDKARIRVSVDAYNLGNNPAVATDIDMRNLDDNGSFTVTPDMLSGYPAGTLLVNVVRSVEKEGAAGNRRYSMMVYSEVTARSVLVP